MDLHEQLLRDEVIYLHSLWHRGPPGNPNPIPYPRYESRPVVFHPQPFNPPPLLNNVAITSTNYNNKRKREKIKPQNPPPENSDIQWQSKSPVEESSATPSGWPALKSRESELAKIQLSQEEKEKLIPFRMQLKGLEASREFLSKKSDSDEEEEDDEDDDEDTDDDCEECEEYKFFMNLFNENSELKAYYKNNYERGDFYCLVCGGIGKKVWKRYNNCVAIVQHSSSISYTAKKKAHRAYGHVICKVLGLDINHLRSIIPSKPDDSQVGPSNNVNIDEDNLSNQREVSKDIMEENPPSLNNNGFTISKNKRQRLRKRHKTQVLNKENESDPPAETSDIQSQRKSPALKSPESSKKPLSEEEKPKSVASQVQKKALEASRNYFLNKSASNGQEKEKVMDDDKKCDEYNFFMNLFMEDSDLMDYFKKNCKNGEFYCFVCCGIGKKVWKTYKYASGIIQHARTISDTTKEIEAHRAYGQVICNVIGLDINRSSTDDTTTSQSSAQINDLQVDPNNNVDAGNTEVTVAETTSNAGGTSTDMKLEHPDNGVSDLVANVEDLMDCFIILKNNSTEGTEIEIDKTKPGIDGSRTEVIEEDSSAKQNKEMLDNEVAANSPNLT